MILIIAYGNSLRRDDGAGLLLAEKLEAMLQERGQEVLRMPVHQLTPELAESVGGGEAAAVIFVDTRIARPEEKDLDLKIRMIDPEDDSPSLGHHLNPSLVLAYARWLYGKEPPAWILTAPGVNFEHGEDLSDVARNAISKLPDLLATFPNNWPTTR